MSYGSDPDYDISSMVCPATGDSYHPLYQFPLADKLYVYLLQCDCIFGGIYFGGAVEWLEHPDSGIKAPYIYADRLLYGRADLIAVGMVQRLEAKVTSLEESLKTTDSLHAAVTDRLDQEINDLKKENGELKRSLNESNTRLATLERGLAALQNQSVSPVQGQRVLVSQQQIPWPTNVTQKSTGHSSSP